MGVARETFSLTIPFVIGVAIATYSLKILYINDLWLCIGACTIPILTLAATCFFFLTHTKNFFKTATYPLSKILLWLTFLLAGCSVCLIAAIPYLRPIVGHNNFVQDSAELFKSLIDSIPYRYEESNALVKAFLAGDRSSLSYDVRTAFRAGGASHILALSGMHLGIIYLIVSKALMIFGNSLTIVKVRSAVILICSGFFTIMTGAAPSLVRAFLFIMLREFAVLTHRRADNLNVLCVALMLQLTVSPDVISSVGFQLSYLAVLGIVLLFPPLNRLWNSVTHGIFVKSMRWIWSLSALSISCQALTAPVAWLYFGTFPQYFLITNLLCMPLSCCVIGVSLLTIPLYAAGLCPDFLLRLNDILIKSLVYVLQIISSMNTPT